MTKERWEELLSYWAEEFEPTDSFEDKVWGDINECLYEIARLKGWNAS